MERQNKEEVRRRSIKSTIFPWGHFARRFELNWVEGLGRKGFHAVSLKSREVQQVNRGGDGPTTLLTRFAEELRRVGGD